MFPAEAGFRVVYYILPSLSEEQYAISQNLFVVLNNGIGPQIDAHCQTNPASGSNQFAVVAFALNLEPSTWNL